MHFNTSGGRISGETFGGPQGRVVFYLHGQFSSRKEAQYFHYAAVERGVRLVALDRPGFGDSPHVPGRRVEDWPPVLRDIADQLGAERFGVLGISAGAKYALATALAMPERVTAVALASAFGPMAETGMAVKALPRVRATLWLYRKAPWLGGALASLAAFVMSHGTAKFIRFFQIFAPRTEREVLVRPEVLRVAVDTLECSAKQGAAGLAHEFRLIIEPWALPLDEIRVPVTLVHGIEDRVAPLGMATALAKQIRGSRLIPVEDAGHVSLLVKHAREILEKL